MSTRRSKNVALEGHRKKRNSTFIAILFAFTLVLMGSGVWTATLQVGNASAQGYATPDVPPAPTIGGPGDLKTVPFMLNLPAGINLISAPLDAGSGPTIGAFEGIEPDWPFLFQWDASSQRFLGPKDSMLAPGAGYWYYTPAPTTLLIHGEPYPVLKHLTKDITPGWHLIGVPFIEGIDWSDFHLYHGSNPVGIETARELGWISSDVLTMQGSRWHKHETGTPFEPGSAYWIKTTVPLSVRAHRAAVSEVAPPPPPENLNNLDDLIKKMNEMTETGEDIKAGKMTTGGFSASGVFGAVFGLANLIVQKKRYDNIMEDLNTMDGKIDQLLTDVGAIQGQLAGIMNAIQGLQDYITFESKLYPPQSDAEQWIAQFYHDVSQAQQSYNWGRWKLAGCDVGAGTCVSGACVGGNTPGSACTTDENCLSCTNEVTNESAQAFAAMFAKDPATDPPTLAINNFFLWWAYGVQATQAGGITPYTQRGSTARNLVDNIHYALTNGRGTSQNALRAYMEWVFSTSACGTDVTACDLYAEVYLPVEAYFQQLISDQITLVEAIGESFAVLATARPDSYGSSLSDYLTGADGFIKKLADEAEILVETAEQIALYRLADGRFDWSSFGTSDAAQLLARADFAAARIASRSPARKPWPWPPGVTGRIFYTEQQALPPSTTIHKACQGATCATLTEVVPSEMSCHSTVPDLCSVTGDWPYLQWTLDSTGSIAIGRPATMWKIRRIAPQPQPLAAGTYQVASINSQFGNSNLVVAEYGYDYTNPPADPTRTVPFGSFNNVEGMLGIGALGANRTYSGGSDDKLRNFTRTESTNYTQMTVAYKQSDSYGTGNWSENIKIQIPSDSTFDTYPRVKVFWPSTTEISLGEHSVNSASCCWDYYYQQFWQYLHLLDGDSVVTDNSLTKQVCGTNHFFSCNYSSLNRNGSAMLTNVATLSHGKTYTLQAHFHDEIWGYYYCQNGSNQYLCERGPNSGSHATWTVFNPTITLVK